MQFCQAALYTADAVLVYFLLFLLLSVVAMIILSFWDLLSRS